MKLKGYVENTEYTKYTNIEIEKTQLKSIQE